MKLESWQKYPYIFCISNLRCHYRERVTEKVLLSDQAEKPSADHFVTFFKPRIPG